MRTADSILIPLVDAGCLNGLRASALGSRYRFWRDEDGMRHVFSVYGPENAPSYPDAIAVVARRTPAGSIAMWAGPTGPAAEQAARRLDGDEIHIHVLGEQAAPALRRLLARSTQAPRVAGTEPQRPARPEPKPVLEHVSTLHRRAA